MEQVGVEGKSSANTPWHMETLWRLNMTHIRLQKA